ncbi:basic form of pathogenesis-related protein 1-like [Durio zibethinus]|uniref:Pathogenesis-related protein 1 n=1 Tax=Durio zibethinus TaxID=66656 RepID=A0A6P6ABP7_DURZI|nr:basic form of pathogenesis-related protein 1-like [Durio zibethinus]
MGLTKVSVAICLLSLTLAHVSRAQNSPQGYLSVHNAARAQVGVEPITWDPTLVAYAMEYAIKRIADCELIHSDGPYGENLAKFSYAITGAEAVKSWVDEKPNYNYAANKCIGGDCLNYTQVVWRNSTHLGCATFQCNNGWWFATCNYDPPGNYVGERPY